MLKPVSILALDPAAASLAAAVQQRVAVLYGLDDLVQMRETGTDLAQLISSIYARRQSPASPLRMRDDISTRELVLLVVSAASPGSAQCLDLAREVRQLYDMRRHAEFYTIELLCLLPDLFAESVAADYGTAYSLLKLCSGVEEKPFDAVWLLDATNGHRVKFGTLIDSLASYAEAVAGALTFEPELSGALSGAFTPRGKHATFSSFGYAELFFPRAAALQRLEARLASELVRGKLLEDAADAPPQLAARQFVVADEFAVPLSRIGVEAGQSLFDRFQPRTAVGEKTRDAEEVIAAVRSELKTHRDGKHLQALHTVAAQGDQTALGFAAQLAARVDGTLDRAGYPAAIRLLEALLDPLPDLHADAGVAPRNMITEINTATAALDSRLSFTPRAAASEGTRKRIRELDTLLRDQQLVAETLSPLDSREPAEGDTAFAPDPAGDAARDRAEILAAMQQELSGLTLRLPDLLFAEEAENNAARNAAREAEASRLADETRAREQQLRELFAAKPRAEQNLREALETRRAWMWRQVWWAVAAVAAIYALPLGFDALWPEAGGLNWRGIHWTAITVLTGLTLSALIRYAGNIAPLVRAAREHLQRIVEQIEVTDRAKSAAHNDELQFEYDVVHRRTALSVLRRTREAAKSTLDTLRTRVRELAVLADSFVPEPIASGGLSIPLLEDAEVDAWYGGTTADRTLAFREFFELCVKRSQSARLPLEELRQRVAAYVATAFEAFRGLTLPQALKLLPDATAAQRLKRFGEYSAPLIELRDDDLRAREAMQRDTTLWIDPADAAFVSGIQRRLSDAVVKPAADPLRIHALSRVLHYPGYVLGQLEYYRAQYDPAGHPESAGLPDLLPNELLLTGAVRTAYEQVLLGCAFGAIAVAADGQLSGVSSHALLGDSHLAAAQRLASTGGIELRRQLESEIEPRLSVAADVTRDLRRLAESAPPLSPLDRDLIGGLLKKYGSEF